MYKEARSGRGERNPESTENRYLLCFPAINIPAALPWDASTIIQLILLDYLCTTTASASQGLKSSFLFLARGNLSSLWRCLYSTSTRDKGSNITLMNSWNSNHSRLGRQKKKKKSFLWCCLDFCPTGLSSECSMYVLWRYSRTRMLNGNKYDILFNNTRDTPAWKVEPLKSWKKKTWKVLT